MVAVVSSFCAVNPALPSCAESAIVKHPACAAARSSSGFVPTPFSNRVLNEYCVCFRTPLSVAFACGPVGDDAKLARSPFCALASGRRKAAGADSETAGNRYVRRECMACRRTVSYDRRSLTWDAGGAVALGIPGIECAHLRDLRWKAGCLVFQSGRGEFAGRNDRSRVVSFAVLPREDALRRAQWLDRIREPERSLRRCLSDIARALLSDCSSVFSSAGHTRTFSDGTLLPVCP